MIRAKKSVWRSFSEKSSRPSPRERMSTGAKTIARLFTPIFVSGSWTARRLR